MNTINFSDLCTTAEAAKAVRLHPGTLKQWRGYGLGPPFIRLGRKILYRRGDLESWLQANRQVDLAGTTDDKPSQGN